MEADKLRFASVFGSHMVLQKDRVNRIWGFADSGSVDMKVYLTISGSNTVEYYVSTPTHCKSYIANGLWWFKWHVKGKEMEE